MSTITIWDKGEAFCGQCHATKRAFDAEGVVYQTRDITADENAAQLAEFKDQGHLEAPIVQTPTDTWSGMRPDKIKSAAAEARASQPQMSQPGVAGPGLS